MRLLTFNRRDRRRDEPRPTPLAAFTPIGAEAGAAAISSLAQLEPDPIDFQPAVARGAGPISRALRLTSKDSFAAPDLTPLITSEYNRWWNADYSVAGLKRLGEDAFWVRDDEPTFEFAGRRWTIYHMPLCDPDGEPSPKLLMLAQAQSAQWRDLLNRLNAEELRSVLESRPGLDKEAVAFFAEASCFDLFTARLQEKLNAADDRAIVRGVVAPCETRIAHTTVDCEIIFSECFLYGSFRLENVKALTVEFYRCAMAGVVDVARSKLDWLLFSNARWLSSTANFDPIGDYGVVRVADSKLTYLTAYSSEISRLAVNAGSEISSLFVNMPRCGDIDVLLDHITIRHLFYINAPNAEFKPQINVRIDNSTLLGPIDLRAQHEPLDLDMTNCTVVGPVEPYGVKLSPGSTFSAVRFEIAPAAYVKNIKREKQIDHDFAKRRGWLEDEATFRFDDTAEAHDYVLRAESGYRFLRKLARDNKQTEHELTFYGKEYEARRNRPDLPRHERAILFVYDVMSQFGSSLIRPLQVWLASFLGFSALTTAGGLLASGEFHPGDAARWTLDQFTLPPSVWDPEMRPPNGLVALHTDFAWVLSFYGTFLGVFISLPLIAMFLIALRRKFQID